MNRSHLPSRRVVLALIAATFLLGSPVGADVGAGNETQLSAFAAVVLGLVEGLTEYLPVSSTGHLLVTNKLLGLGGTEASDQALDTYAICIQAGAILAVLLLYWGRVRQMLDGLVGRSDEGRRVLLAVIGAFVPTAIIGLVLKDVVRDRLFGPLPIAIAWVVGGVFILWLTQSGLRERAGTALGEITPKMAVIIGTAQAIALWPGVSRSLVTLSAGLIVGLAMPAAVEFAFLLGLLTLTAATVLEGLENGPELIDTFGIATPLLGLAVAFVSALFAVRWMVDFLNKNSMNIFGFYRIIIGGAALIAIAGGWL